MLQRVSSRLSGAQLVEVQRRKRRAQKKKKKKEELGTHTTLQLTEHLKIPVRDRQSEDFKKPPFCLLLAII